MIVVLVAATVAGAAVVLTQSGRARQVAAIPLQWWLASRVSVEAVTTAGDHAELVLENSGRTSATVFTTVDCRGPGPADARRFTIVDPVTGARVNAVLKPGEARTFRLAFVDRESQPDPTHGPVAAGHCRILSADLYGYKTTDQAIAESLPDPSP